MVDRGSFTNANNVFSINDLTHVDDRVRSINVPFKKNTPLPIGWSPDKWSVICGRGKECFDHCKFFKIKNPKVICYIFGTDVVRSCGDY